MIPTAGSAAPPEYGRLRESLPPIVCSAVPEGATVLVVSRGDDDLLELPARTAWHFPQSPSGEYAGYHPESGLAAVEHLEALRGRGADYLVLPATSFWWLDHYQELARHLEESCTPVAEDRHCLVYRLRREGLAGRAYRSLRLRRGRARRRGVSAGRGRAPVSVVVTSHNKSQYLGEALDALARQTAAPLEVLVVDDASTDDTRDVALARGAAYERVEYRSPGLARNHGAALSSGENLCFFDADDLLDPDSLELHVEALRADPQAGFAYGRIREFGEREELWPRQAWDYDLLRRRNYIPSASVVRSAAFRQVGGYPDLAGAEDWGLWLRLSRAGWRGVPCRATWGWRRTAHSRNARRTWGRSSTWFEEAPVECMSVAVFTAFSGKRHLLREWFETLRTIDWPREMVQLWLYDNSGADDFHVALREEAAALEGFGGLHLVRDAFKVDTGLVDYGQRAAPRDTLSAHHASLRGISDQVGRIYTWAARHVEADLVAFLEDDVIPDTRGRFLRTLIETLEWDTQAVFGWYRSRLGNLLVVDPPERGEPWAWRCRTTPERGATEVAGGGLGCALFRREALRERSFKLSEPLHGPDATLGRELWGEGRRMVCSWDVSCVHVTSKRGSA